MNGKMNPARVDREDERRMLPCRNFLDGYCPKGPRCRFFHPVISSIPTVIRVPNLPTSFQQNNFGQFPSHPASTGGAHSVFTISPTPSARSHMGLSPKLGGLGSPASARFLAGMNGFGNSFSRSMPRPLASPTYSEYEMAYAQHMEIQKERERRAAAPPIPENNENLQDTVFNHIDWKEFLTPGARPPPPTHVPYMSNSPGRAAETLDSLESLIRTGNTKSQHQEFQRNNFFAERLALAERDIEFQPSTPVSSREIKIPSPSTIREFTSQIKSSRPLSAKEELQMKVKQIAKELATEPAQPVQSMDIFFRNYTFESVPTAPSSEQDLVGNSGEIEEETPHATIITVKIEPMETDLKDDEMKVELIAKNAFSSSTSDSGISSSEFTSSGDSASSMECVKDENSSEKSFQA